VVPEIIRRLESFWTFKNGHLKQALFSIIDKNHRFIDTKIIGSRVSLYFICSILVIQNTLKEAMSNIEFITMVKKTTKIYKKNHS